MSKVLLYFVLLLYTGFSVAEDTTKEAEQSAPLSGAVTEQASDKEIKLPEKEASPNLSSLPQKNDAANISKINSSMTSGQDWVMVILSFFAIILFILALGWAAKRFGGLSAMGVRDMKVVAALPLGTREKVAIIDVKGTQILIGITPQNINHIHTFDDPVVSSSEKSQSDFAQKLTQIMKAKSVVKDEQS